MRAGRLRTLVTIEKPVETDNAAGEVVQQWQPFAVVWAEIEPLRGEERVAAQQLEATVDYRVRMRWIPAGLPRAKYQINTGGATGVLEIQSVINPNLRGKELELLCRELVG